MAARSSRPSREVVWTEPSRRASAIIGVVFVVATIVGLVALPSLNKATFARSLSLPPDGVKYAAGFLTLVLLLGFASALVNGRRWFLTRTILRMSNTAAQQAADPDVAYMPPPPSTSIPELVIDGLRTSRRSRPKHLRHVSRALNVTGHPPMQIAYLRVFDNQPRARTFVQGAWREFGYVLMLRSASSVTPREFRLLRQQRVADVFVHTHDVLDRTLDRAMVMPIRSGRRTFRDLGPTTIHTRDKYGAYPVVAVCCHGSFWREAVDELLRRADLVCLDLSGYTRKQAGTAYEIQRVVDCFPIERVVFLCDPRTKAAFVTDTIDAAWTRMATGSPNEGPVTRRTNVLRTDQLRTTVTRDQHGNEVQRQTRLVAIPTQTRTAAALIQNWLEGLPPNLDRRGAPLNTGVRHDAVLSDERWPPRSITGIVGVLLLTAVAAFGVRTAASEIMPTTGSGQHVSRTASNTSP